MINESVGIHCPLKRNFVYKTKAAVIGISESWLDSTVTDN